MELIVTLGTLFALVALFFVSNQLILTKLNESNNLRVWWEKNVCSSKDLEPYE